MLAVHASYSFVRFMDASFYYQHRPRVALLRCTYVNKIIDTNK